MRSTRFFTSVRSLAPLGGILTLAALGGCSAIVAPDSTRLGPGVDSGVPSTPDAFVPLGVDAFVPLGVDAFVADRPDAWAPVGVDADVRPPDAFVSREPDAYTPMSCADGSHCDGEVAVVCLAGIERRTDCAAMGLICEAAVCRPMRCTPGTAFCSADGTGLVTCNPDGSGMTFSTCPMGCDPGATMCRGSTMTCEGLPEIMLGGTRRVDLCDSTGANTYARSEGCSGGSASSSDATFVLRLRTATTVEIDLRDVDPTVGIDTIVYLRRSCNDAASQVACSDDIPCADSDISMGCMGGVQVRQSRFTARLEAGTYFIVADAFRYSDFDCGEVELRVGTP